MASSFLRAVSIRAADSAQLHSSAQPPSVLPPTSSREPVTKSARAAKRAPIGSRSASAAAAAAVSAASALPPALPSAGKAAVLCPRVTLPAHTPKIKPGLIPRSTWRPASDKQSAEPPLPELASAVTIRTPSRPELHAAAKAGDCARLEALLVRDGDRTPSPSPSSSPSSSPLSSSPSSHDLNAAHLGQCPIHLAAKGGHAECVALLLDHGADLHARATNTGNKNSTLVWDFGGATPLHCAAEMNRTDVIALLLARGHSIAAAANQGDTPLHFAAREGWLAATKLLVARGADPRTPNAGGHTAHDDAMQCGGGKCPCEDLSDREWAAVAAFLAQAMSIDGDEERRLFAQRVWERPVAAVLHDAAEGETCPK